MANRRALSIRRLRGILLSFLICFALLGLLPGIAHAGDVAWSEAPGELGLNAAQRETAVQEASGLSVEVGAGVAWLDALVYVIVASLILVAYGVAARKLPWLRPRRREKP